MLLNSRAFTLLELVIVLVVVGLIAAIGVPGINKARNQAELENMRSRAAQLQSAKLALIETLGRDTAESQWVTTYTTDESRYTNLLRQYLPQTFPDTIATLIPSPYSVNLGISVDTTVVLTAPDDTLDPHDVDTNLDNIPLQKY